MALKHSNLYYALFLFLSFLQILNSQNITCIQTEILPKVLDETSGIISLNQGLSFWTINDGGNDPILYEINSKSEILRRVVLKNATNIDWEDLTTDYKQYVYIADCGNNINRSEKHAIYQILISDLISKDSIFGKRIEITFDPIKPIKKRHLDIEAMCWVDQKLYLFTKNWSSWIKNKSIVYCYDTQIDSGHLNVHSIINLGWHFFAEQQITGACYDNESEHIFLISATSIYELPKIQLNKEKIKIKKRYGTFSFLSQKEAICSIGQDRFVITQEKNKQLRQKATIFEVLVNQ